jgi:hypothetical protein
VLQNPALTIARVNADTGSLLGFCGHDAAEGVSITKIFPTESEAATELWRLVRKHFNLRNGDPIPGLPGVVLAEETPAIYADLGIDSPLRVVAREK